MTEPIVIDGDVESVTETAETQTSREFRLITHKPSVVAMMSPFGGVQDAGLNVNSDTAAQTLWWMSQDWAVQVLNVGVALPQLTAPPSNWVAGLPEEFLHRRVGTLRKCDVARYYEKHPDAADEHPRLVLSTPGDSSELMPPQVVSSQDLSQDVFPVGYAGLPDSSLLQMDEMLACVVEVRAWVANGEVTAFAPYRIGMVGWDSSIFLEMLFNTEGQSLAEEALAVARKVAKDIDGPPGYAIDLGVTIDKVVTVLRAWPAWAADPLHADSTGVFQAILASHDFDGEHSSWRWNPNRAVYARPEAEPTESTPTPTPEEEEEKNEFTNDDDD